MTSHLDEDTTVALALDDLTDGDRTAALEHLRGCGLCRASYDDTIAAVDAVLPAAPDLQPEPGFDERVLTAMGLVTSTPGRTDTESTLAHAGQPDTSRLHAGRLHDGRAQAGRSHTGRSRALRWLLPALAALFVGLGLGAGATVLAIQDGTSQVAVAGTPLTTENGSVVGSVTPASAAGEPVLVVSVAEAPPGARYTCRVTLADDSTVDVGTWTLADGDGVWVVPGLAPDQVTAVELVRNDGAVWSTADLASA